MRKNQLLLLLTLLVIFLAAGRAEAMDVMSHDGPVSSRARLVDSTAYLPIRDLLGALGSWEVSWDSSRQAALAQGDTFSMTLPTGSSQILVEDIPLDLGSPILLEAGVTYVPLRMVANLCGASVTWNGRGQPITMAHTPPPEHSPEDLYWLSRIISAESQGEPLMGQLAVGSVVMNRVAHPIFPDSIQEVIFDKAYAIQFEPVANGAIYWEPTQQSILAARMTLAGARVVGDCLYFYNPSLSQDTWISSNRIYYTTIGCHKFFL